MGWVDRVECTSTAWRVEAFSAKRKGKPAGWTHTHLLGGTDRPHSIRDREYPSEHDRGVGSPVGRSSPPAACKTVVVIENE